MTDRAPAQYCPYCAGTDLWPHEAPHGAWSCRDCRRVFAVRFLGIAGADPGPADGAVAAGDVAGPALPVDPAALVGESHPGTFAPADAVAPGMPTETAGTP